MGITLQAVRDHANTSHNRTHSWSDRNTVAIYTTHWELSKLKELLNWFDAEGIMPSGVNRHSRVIIFNEQQTTYFKLRWG